MPGTMLKDWYAYVVIGGAVLLMMGTVSWADRLLRAWTRPENLGLVFGVIATWLAVATTPLVLTRGDSFQLARETYPLVLAGALPSLMWTLTADQGDRFFDRFAWLFLLGCLVGFVLQSLSTRFFDIMLQYYYTEAGEEMRGYMQSRPGLTFGNPNIIGLAIAFAGLTAATARAAPTWKIALAVAFSTCLILWTQSRTALFAFGGGMALLAVLQATRLMTGAIAVCVAGAAASLFFDFSSYTERINDLIYRFFYDRSSMDERQQIWMKLLVNSEWPYYWWFGLGPDKKREAIFDSGYVLVLYRYGAFGLTCHVWWQIGLLLSGIYDYVRSPTPHLGMRRAVLAACFASASYAMAPLTDPRLCALFILMVVSTTVRYRIVAPLRPVLARRVQSSPLGRRPRPCMS